MKPGYFWKDYKLQGEKSDEDKAVAAAQLIQIKYLLVGMLALATGKGKAA